MHRTKRVHPVLVVLGVITVLVGACVAAITPRAAKEIRNQVIYRMPVRLPGQPACPGCNVIILNLDTLRAAEMPCYGYARNTTPNLCAFAKKNILFTRFYTQSSFTLDSHTSIFTGLYPSSHHVLDALKDSLSNDIPTITQVLKKNGYRNIWGGLTEDVNLPLDKGMGRDYDEVHTIDGNAPDWESKYASLLKKLEDGKPTFMFLHSYGVHAPYMPGHDNRQFVPDMYPDIAVTEAEFMPHTRAYYEYALLEFENRLAVSDTPESVARNREVTRSLKEALARNNIDRAREVLWALPEYENFELYFTWYHRQVNAKDPDRLAYYKGLYDERIYQVDKQLGTLFAFLNRPDIKRKTILIVLSDNGEEFMEHGYLDHAWNIYENSTHVPFVVAAPRMQSGVYHDLAQVVDIVPTVLDLVGVRTTIPFDGMSLVPVMSGRGATYVGDRYLIGQHRGNAVVSIRNNRWKMYKNNTAEKKYLELYDLYGDPLETNNVLGKHLDIARLLDRGYEAVMAASPKYASESGEFPKWLDREKRRSLIEEGYF